MQAAPSGDARSSGLLSIAFLPAKGDYKCKSLALKVPINKRRKKADSYSWPTGNKGMQLEGFIS
jgi:hypothetical protein